CRPPTFARGSTAPRGGTPPESVRAAAPCRVPDAATPFFRHVRSGTSSELRAALQDAVDEEMLNRNVARLVQLRVTDERRVRSFTRAEALRFLEAAEHHRL